MALLRRRRAVRAGPAELDLDQRLDDVDVRQSAVGPVD
jgi:hypothetical protein